MVNDRTRHSPFYVAYGQEAIKPAEFLEGVSQNLAAGDFANRIATIYNVAKTSLEAAQASQKRQADRHCSDAFFVIGDHILMDSRNL